MRKRRRARKGWAGQWDRHVWDISAARVRRRPRRTGDVRIMLWSGLLGGLLLFNALQLPTATAPAAFTAPVDETEAPAAIGPVRVIDGDTFDYRGMRIRIADIDTPELRSPCQGEARLAAAATRRLRALLGQGPFELKRLGRDEDRYGRKLRIVLRDGRSIGDMLVAEGLARTWTGRRQPWC